MKPNFGMPGQTMIPASTAVNASASLSTTQPTKPDTTATTTKPNTWSNVKGVNISLDLLGKPAPKQARPTMNQLQGSQSFPHAMAAMNLNSGGAMTQSSQMTLQGMTNSQIYPGQ